VNCAHSAPMTDFASDFADPSQATGSIGNGDRDLSNIVSRISDATYQLELDSTTAASSRHSSSIRRVVGTAQRRTFDVSHAKQACYANTTSSSAQTQNHKGTLSCTGGATTCSQLVQAAVRRVRRMGECSSRGDIVCDSERGSSFPIEMPDHSELIRRWTGSARRIRAQQLAQVMAQGCGTRAGPGWR
jgi:hypothetical protein